MEKKQINNILVKGVNVGYKRINEEDYICLTDLARYVNESEPKIPIQTWMRNKDVVIFLGLWEKLNNCNFKGIEFTTFEQNAGKNSFYLSPQKWVQQTNAVGIITKSGNKGGTYAHKDIAFEFASWLSPEFKLYLITEFQRLKKQENKSVEWNAKRELAKVNYKIHTSSIKENLIVPELSKEQIYYAYASEADLLNVALFGITASEWRNKNKDLSGNMRDYASVEQLLVLANMESYNSTLIEEGVKQEERIIKLNDMARKQLGVLMKCGSKILENKSKE